MTKILVKYFQRPSNSVLLSSPIPWRFPSVIFTVILDKNFISPSGRRPSPLCVRHITHIHGYMPYTGAPPTARRLAAVAADAPTVDRRQSCRRCRLPLGLALTSPKAVSVVVAVTAAAPWALTERFRRPAGCTRASGDWARGWAARRGAAACRRRPTPSPACPRPVTPV